MLRWAGLFIAALSVSCASTIKVPQNPPLAMVKNEVLEKHGDRRIDPYYWLKNRDDQQVIDYLNQENTYAEKSLAPIKNLRQTLFEEMKGRFKKTDQSVPVKDGDYYYYTRHEEQSEYPIIARKKGGLQAEEEVILDANGLAEGESFFNLGNWTVSSDHRYLAYAVDVVGRRIYTIYFKDLNTGKTLSQKIEKVTADMTWAEDGQTLFYAKQNPQTLRYEWIYRYNLKDRKNRLVHHEKDERFYAGVGKTKSKKYVLIEISSKESSEVRWLPAEKPWLNPVVFQPRKDKHEYEVYHAGDHFLVLSNYQAQNFKVFKTPDERRTSLAHWRTYIDHRDDVLISGMSVFKNFVALSVRTGGLTEIELIDRKTGNRKLLDHPEKSHVVYIDANPEYDSGVLRYSYESMTTPPTVIDYTYADGKKEIRKVKEVLGGFNAANYLSERIFAIARDGTKVPMSIVYRKGFEKNGKAPLLLYGYGSYGSSMEPWFSETRLSLLDRGFVFVIAHIRGGSEMGRHWYENGKRFHKKNTFNDFVDCAQYLIEEKYTSSNHLYAMGGSAGGLLMGAVLNDRPDLFHGVVTQVPFVDALTTMLDESLPLTTFEYEEWGNPNEKDYYEYMKSYSPYDNLKPQAYPHLLVSTGLHDSQVQYWEPAKWVAKLRRLKTDDNLLVLDTNMEAGHGGKSGRFKSLEDRARDYAFVLYLEGLRN